MNTINLNTTKYNNEDLLSLTYNEVRKLCKDNGLKANGKKVKLIETLASIPAIDKTVSHNWSTIEKANEIVCRKRLMKFSAGVKEKEEDLESLLLRVEKPINTMLRLLEKEKTELDEHRNNLNELLQEKLAEKENGYRRQSYVNEMNELRGELQEKEDAIHEKETQNQLLCNSLKESNKLVEKYKVFNEGVINLEVRNVSKIQNTVLTSDSVMICNLPWRIRFMTKYIPNASGQTIKYAGVYVRCDLERFGQGCSCRARGSFFLKCFKGNDFMRRTVYNTYSVDCLTWGFASFIPWARIADASQGYNVNDMITIEALVEVELPDKFSKGRPILVAQTTNEGGQA